MRCWRFLNTGARVAAIHSLICRPAPESRWSLPTFAGGSIRVVVACWSSRMCARLSSRMSPRSAPFLPINNKGNMVILREQTQENSCRRDRGVGASRPHEPRNAHDRDTRCGRCDRVASLKGLGILRWTAAAARPRSSLAGLGHVGRTRGRPSEIVQPNLPIVRATTRRATNVHLGADRALSG